jgi:O-antigen/teichoic acid export membrane protein
MPLRHAALQNRHGAGLMPNSHFSGARFRKAIRSFVVGRAAQAVATLAVTLLAVRLLAPGPYGVYMILWGLVELGSPLTSLGLLPAVQRFLPELAERGTSSRLKRFVNGMLLARFGLILLGCGAVVAFWPALSAWLGDADAQQEVAWLGGAMLACVLASRFSAEMLECLLEQRYAQTARALLPFLRAAGLVALWLVGQVSLIAMLWVDLAAAAVAMLLGERWLAKSLRNLHPSGDFVVDRRELIQFIWHMSGAQLLNAVASAGTVRLIVARLLGLEVAGQFGFLQQLIAIGNRYLPSVLMANLVRPMLIARHAAGKAQEVAIGFGLLWKVNIGLVWPGVPLMVIAGDGLIRMASGGRVLDAGLPMALLVLGLAARGQNQIVVMAMQVYRYTSMARTVSAIGLLAPILMVLFADLGMVGMALGVSAALLIRSIAGLALLQRMPMRLQLDWGGGSRIFLALVIATTAAWALFRLTGPYVAAGAMFMAYLVSAFLLKPLLADEWTLLSRALGQRVSSLKGWVR